LTFLNETQSRIVTAVHGHHRYIVVTSTTDGLIPNKLMHMNSGVTDEC